jgi:hypothetical protein
MQPGLDATARSQRRAPRARWRLRGLAAQEGGATVEFALTTLVLVPTLLYAIFFYEVSFAKLKANEASRYLVWEMTAFGLSDWFDQKHDARFEQAKSQIMSEVIERYGDDLDGATPTIIPNYRAHKPITIEVSFDQAQASLQNVSAEVFTVADFSGLDSLVGKGFEWFGFNSKGKASGSLSMTVHNVWLQRGNMLLGDKASMLPTNELKLKAAQSLVADQWDLKSGEAVVQVQHLNCSSAYCRQVGKMSFFGITDKVDGALDGVSDLVSKIGMHNPLAAVVASIPLDGRNDGAHNLDAPKFEDEHDPHDPLKKHYTNVFKDTYDKKRSRYYKIYQRLGPCYMGCAEPLKQEGECPYEPREKPDSSAKTICK